jgi:hypothetical protein
MMKPAMVAGVALLSGATAFDAMAACSGTQISDGALTSLLSGNSMCQSSPEVAQEQHVAGGVLQDYKKGPSDPVDPTSTIGSWAVSGSGASTIVTYTYGSNSYSYNVFLVSGTAGADGSTYDFCTGASLKASARLRLGFGSPSTYSPVCP